MDVEVVGTIPVEFVEFVKSTLNWAYEAIGTRPEYLEVYIYESTGAKLHALLESALLVGVPVTGDYPVSHEAWLGWPRIHVDYEKLRALDRDVVKALLVHEAAHSVLHGNLASYVVTLREDLASKLGEIALPALYVASTVVKDVEVHELLAERGLRDLVEAYYNYVAKELPGVVCNGVLGILELSKLIPPCLFVECKPHPKLLLSEACRALYEKVLEAAREVIEEPGDLYSRVNRLLERALGLAEETLS